MTGDEYVERARATPIHLCRLRYFGGLERWSVASMALRLGGSVVIVGSILLAFGIDAWYRERQHRAEEARIIEDLSAEFLENRARRRLQRRPGTIARSSASTSSDPEDTP